jgi:mono/diheme cytochrome c family protein
MFLRAAASKATADHSPKGGPPVPYPRRFAWAWLAPVLIFAPGFVHADDERTGEQIYRKLCASCHGINGEGVEDQYAAPLEGDQSVDELARLIQNTMPKDKPKTCVGEDARKVAAYIHETFYSEAAQERVRSARI